MRSPREVRSPALLMTGRFGELRRPIPRVEEPSLAGAWVVRCFSVLFCVSMFSVLLCASLCFSVLLCASLCFLVLTCASLCTERHGETLATNSNQVCHHIPRNIEYHKGTQRNTKQHTDNTQRNTEKPKAPLRSTETHRHTENT